MYKILFIESGDYLYMSKRGSYFYSIYEISKEIAEAYIVYTANSKEIVDSALSRDWNSIRDAAGNYINISQNLTLFEIIEKN